MLNRQKEFLNWIFSGFATSALIVGGVWLSDHHVEVMAQWTGLSTGSTSMASVSPNSATSIPEPAAKIENGVKSAVLEKHNVSFPEQKASGDLLVSLTSTDGRRSDGTLALTASITATADLAGLKYNWILPYGVTLVSGDLSGDIGALASGAVANLPFIFSVTSQTSSSVSSQIHFQVYRMMGLEKIGQVAAYDALNQDEIERQLKVTRENLASAVSGLSLDVSRKPSSVPTENRRME